MDAKEEQIRHDFTRFQDVATRRVAPWPDEEVVRRYSEDIGYLLSVIDKLRDGKE